jgi:4-hydroxy-3-polyprenylbenzoate decarboxylase
VVANLFASPKRLARIFGTKPETLTTGWLSFAHRRIKPKVVSSAPVKDIIKTGSAIDLGEFPIPTHFSNDAGRYITAGVIFAKDPITQVGNMSFARLQVMQKNTLGTSLHSRGDLWRYHQKQEELECGLEVAIAVGVHPAISIAAATQLPPDEDELDLAGGILDSPVDVIKAETVDLFVPASAEMIIEGIIEPKIRVDEGPFGEYTGYASARSTRNLLTVTAVTHRKDMIFQDITPGYSKDHLNLSKISRVPRVFEALRRSFSNVTNIHYPHSGTHYHCYVSIHNPLPGQAKQVLAMLFGLDMYLKLVIIVDDDIDVTNEQEVLWAVATRFQADRDTILLEGVVCNLLDPSAENGLSAKLGIDATFSPNKKIEKTQLPESIVAEVKKTLEALLINRS